VVTNGARIYEITIRGVASQLVRIEFDDVQVRVDDTSTYLRTDLVDQTVLFGLIRRIEDLGLVLLDVATIIPAGRDGQSVRPADRWFTNQEVVPDGHEQ
jgi:hypothetical protein